MRHASIAADGSRLVPRARPGVARLDRGALAVIAEPSLLAGIRGAGVRLEAVDRAEAIRGGIAFPVVSGRMTRDRLRGAIRHGGAVRLTRGDAALELSRPMLVLAHGEAWLTARNGAMRLVVASVDLRAESTHRRPDAFSATNVPARICSPFCTLLQDELGVHTATGAALGHLSVAAYAG